MKPAAPPKLFICPECGRKSLYWSQKAGLWQCAWKGCARVFSRRELKLGRPSLTRRYSILQGAKDTIKLFQKTIRVGVISTRFFADITLTCMGISGVGLGLLGIVLGAHGLYVHFSIVEWFAREMEGGADPSYSLFLVVEVPSWFQSSVGWATMKGLESWVIPAAIIIGGIFLAYVGFLLMAYSVGKLGKIMEKIT